MEGRSKDTFFSMKEICAAEILLHYPDFAKLFDVHINSSKYQMGSIISQEDLPVANWIRNLTTVQKKYLIIKQELLATVKCLKEFRHMLLGHKIRVHTNNNKITYKDAKYRHEVHQRLCLEAALVP